MDTCPARDLWLSALIGAALLVCGHDLLKGKGGAVVLSPVVVRNRTAGSINAPGRQTEDHRWLSTLLCIRECILINLNLPFTSSHALAYNQLASTC